MSDAHARAAEAVRRHIDAAKKAAAGNDVDAARRALERARDVILAAEPAAFETMPRDLLTVAMNLEAGGDIESARALLDVLASSIGRKTPDAAKKRFDALTRRGLLSMHVRDYAEAAEDFADAATEAMHAWGNEDRYARSAMLAQARALRRQQKYAEALPVLKDLRRIFEKHVGDADEDYIETISLLGVAYDQTGEYAEAEATYREHLRAATYRYGVHHPVTIEALYHLAELARILGDHAEAEPGFRRVLELLREVHPDSEALALTQNNYGELLSRLDRHDEALEMIRAALTLRRSLFGDDSPEAARSLLSLGRALGDAGRRGEAREALQRASEIDAKDGDVQTKAAVQSALAMVDAQSGSAGEDAVLRMDAAFDEMLAAFAQQPYIADALVEVLKCTLSQKRWPQMRAQLAKTVGLADLQLVQVLRLSSRRFLESHAASYSTLQDLALALVLHAPDATDQDRANAYAVVQRRKGLETRALRLWKPGGDGVALVDPRERRVPDRAETKRRQSMLRLLFEGDNAAGTGHAEEDLRRLRREQELWERSRAAPRSRNEEEIAICDVETARLGTDERTAIIEYSRFREPLERDGSERYTAFVIRGTDAPPELFDLGPAREIDEAVHELRTAVAEPASSDWVFSARFLYNRLLQPLRPSLDGIERLRIAADGALTMLPFELLARSRDVLLLDEFRVAYLLFGSEPWRLQQHVNLDGPPLVIASPDFGGEAAFFTPLDSALAEGVSIAKKLGLAACVSGAAATEAVLELDAAPEILHIATHGFFFRTPPPALPPDSYLARRASFRDPLERCGLAFAGANRFVHATEPPEEWEDGLVFGADIADLDLRGTDLAVIAACRSAEGEVRAGDMADGVRRALKAAGARTVVCSLWDVPDEITREIMEAFYDALLAGADRIDALHDARLRVRARMPREPFFWGAMILDGDVGPLRRMLPAGTFKIGSVSMAGISDEPEVPPPPQQLGEEVLDEALALGGENVEQSVALFRRVMAMENVSSDLLHRARYFLAGVLRSSGDQSLVRESLAEYELLLADETLADQLRTAARFDRVTAYIILKDFAAALKETDELLRSRHLPVDARVRVLVHRGDVFMTVEAFDAAREALTAIIDMRGAPRDARANALCNRAHVRRSTGDLEGAIQDATLALAFGDQTSDATIGSLLTRAVAALQLGDVARALDDVEQLLPAIDVDGRQQERIPEAREALARGDRDAAKATVEFILEACGPFF